MLWVISVAVLLSCAIDSGFANEVRYSRTANSSDVHSIVTDLDKTGKSVVYHIHMDVIFTYPLRRWTVASASRGEDGI